jgi:hypothetical protein
VEKEHPNEAQTFSELAATMRHISEIVNDRSRHAFRSVHAKSHCLLRAEMTVLGDIGAPFQQGLFEAGSQHPIIMRFSTNPGDVLPDSISSPRGLAVKVVAIVNAEMVPSHVGQVNAHCNSTGLIVSFNNSAMKVTVGTIRIIGDEVTKRSPVLTRAKRKSLSLQIPLAKRFARNTGSHLKP